VARIRLTEDHLCSMGRPGNRVVYRIKWLREQPVLASLPSEDRTCCIFLGIIQYLENLSRKQQAAGRLGPERTDRLHPLVPLKSKRQDDGWVVADGRSRREPAFGSEWFWGLARRAPGTKRGRIILFGLDRRIQVGLFTVVMPSMGYGIAIP